MDASNHDTQKIVLLHIKYFSCNREVRKSLTSKTWEWIEKFPEILSLSLQLMRKRSTILGGSETNINLWMFAWWYRQCWFEFEENHESFYGRSWLSCPFSGTASQAALDVFFIDNEVIIKL